ncbi:hypothetical protein [Frigoriglobus tundricola]|uniref:Uncharacterized protein n=1 Tax=Frigoriglobus tundricola TaxID=2774151 RepID=A0A6M5YS89_9BACT|nr:hypothetical protein [Frigoriglobus tundricola]QJW96947.1 hypothetical protein FTUN_4507 [Frigoriglobus tundricola]
MPSRTRSSRPWLWSLPLVALAAAPVAAQPPSPLDLVRGLRENGQVDLAVEYLKVLEGKPLSADDKAALPLERAKCMLESSEDEPDEGTRLGIVAEAREGLNDFLAKHPKHPRAVEALLAVAKLTALDAKEQLNRARKVEVPPPSDVPAEVVAREAAQDRQKSEASKARPLFLEASKRFGEASARLRARLEDKALDAFLRRTLEREAFEAELASGINQFNTAETFMPAGRVTGAEKVERNKFLEQAKATFGKLANGSPSNRTVWVARAWATEVTFEQDDFNAAANEVAAILRAPVQEAEEGKRLAQFFQLRRNYLAALGERSKSKVEASLKEGEIWLKTYAPQRVKPTPEVFAVRYYRARLLQTLAESNAPAAKDGKPAPLNNLARAQLKEAEGLYRVLAQSDNDFTARASRQRMAVVRRLLGEADQPVASYTSFETAQLASLIQMSKLAAEEAKVPADAKRVKDLRLATLALLERARDLAAPTDSPADVTDVLLRLIYFYQLTDQPYQAAVLGEHVAQTARAGGKAAVAGLLGLNGYVAAGTRVKGDDPDAVAAARKVDRERAITLARFLDERYPNDNATDAARHRLALMLAEEKRYPEAFEAVIKVRPGFPQITSVRLLEGYLAGQIINARAEEGQDPPVPAAKKAEVFRRAVADLARVSKPAPGAGRDEVHGYLSARCRMAALLFAQGRADAAAEAAGPGYNQALTIAEEVIANVPTFDALVTESGGTKKPNVDGLELLMLAQDAYSRAVYLRARALIAAGDKAPPAERQQKFAEAEKALAPILESVKTAGPLFVGPIKAWAEGRGDRLDPSKPDGEDNRDPHPVAVLKARVAQLAAAVDKTRVEVVLAGFRLKVKEAKAAEASDLLDLMVKAGGTIEDNLPVLELLSREMAAQMSAYRKQGRAAEADALGAGLAVLLKKFSTVPKLTPQTLLFLGQTLQAIGENEKATEALKKVPAPDLADWDKKKPEDFPAELRGKIKDQINAYSAAQLSLARALRESGKPDEAEKMLLAIIGTNEKKGWGHGRLYFRRELALVYETRGGAATDAAAAKAEWNKAVKEWTTLFQLHRNNIQALPKGAAPALVTQARNAFADAYFDVQRCGVRANEKLLNPNAPAQAARLQKAYEDAGKRFVDMEKQIPAGEWEPEVQHRYADFLKDVPPAMAAYKAAGGKTFLERMPVP